MDANDWEGVNDWDDTPEDDLWIKEAFAGSDVKNMALGQLRNIYEPPIKLYVLGNRQKKKKKGIAIVGSRKATEYGKNVAMQLSKKLSEKGINIISGLAVRNRYVCSFGSTTKRM